MQSYFALGALLVTEAYGVDQDPYPKQRKGNICYRVAG